MLLKKGLDCARPDRLSRAVLLSNRAQSRLFGCQQNLLLKKGLDFARPDRGSWCVSLSNRAQSRLFGKRFSRLKQKISLEQLSNRAQSRLLENRLFSAKTKNIAKAIVKSSAVEIVWLSTEFVIKKGPRLRSTWQLELSCFVVKSSAVEIVRKPTFLG